MSAENLSGLIRCPWCEKSEIEKKYHDEEWGVPLFQDQKLFEFVILDGFQAGLSWKIILSKRENFREAFFDFNAQKLASCQADQVAKWMLHQGLVRNRLKLEGVIKNAQAYLRVLEEWGSFSKYLWHFSGGEVLQGKRKIHSDIPTVCPEAIAMSMDMKKRGFKFCGPTICYAFMQAAGMVNDHLETCFRYGELSKG